MTIVKLKPKPKPIKASKKVSFLPIDETGRYSIPISREVADTLKRRGQPLTAPVYIVLSNYILSFPKMTSSSIRDMDSKIPPDLFTKVRITVERPLVESCCYSLMLLYPSNDGSWKEAWAYFSRLVLRVADTLYATTLIEELAQAELATRPTLSIEKIVQNVQKVKKEPVRLSQKERELEFAKNAAIRELKEFREVSAAAAKQASKEIETFRKEEKIKKKQEKQKKIFAHYSEPEKPAEPVKEIDAGFDDWIVKESD